MKSYPTLSRLRRHARALTRGLLKHKEDKLMEQSGPELRKDKIASMFVSKIGLVLWEDDALL